MRIAICDDEVHDLNIIENYCSIYCHNDTYESFTSASELLKSCETINYDIIFLDIEMEHPNGFEAAQELNNTVHKPIIIFTTQSLQYTIRGYGIAFRYLPKPISQNMFLSTLHDAIDNISPSKIAISTGRENRIILINDILYFESFRHDILFHLQDGTTILAHGSLSEYMNKLAANYFFRIQKSYCINMEYIDYIKGSYIILKNGTSLKISPTRKNEFNNMLQVFMKN